MTEYEKKKIYELRLKGCGYKAIATELVLSRDGVRSFCKRHGLYGNGNVVALNVNEQKFNNLICTNCNKPITQKDKGVTRKFCSDVCRREWWKANPDKGIKKETAIYKFTCKHCGIVFESYGNKKRKFCSCDCYTKHSYYQ